jgi:aldose 1-epimerase
VIELVATDYRLELSAERGGSLLAFEWRGLPVLRSACGPSILDVACFPLVPFSNRVAHGRFAANGRLVRLSPNFPGASHPHPLHGFGWRAEWRVVRQSGNSAVLEHRHDAAEWPWAYLARQEFRLDDNGLTISLAIENRADEPMPAGLGLHPYFPRNERTVYRGLHRGQWRNDEDCLPLHLEERVEPSDWWQGSPVGCKTVDTVYTHREGALSVVWPDRALALVMQPSRSLAHTVVYVPDGEDYFCVEPVSHITDAFNSTRDDAGTRWLAPGERFEASVLFSAMCLQREPRK